MLRRILVISRATLHVCCPRVSRPVYIRCRRPSVRQSAVDAQYVISNDRVLSFALSYIIHRRRSGWNSEGGGHMASADGGSLPNGVWYGEGCPLSSRLAPSSPSGVRGRAPAENGFWRIWRPEIAPFCIYMTKIWGGQFAIASPYSKFWGNNPPVIYARASLSRTTIRKARFPAVRNATQRIVHEPEGMNGAIRTEIFYHTFLESWHRGQGRIIHCAGCTMGGAPAAMGPPPISSCQFYHTVLTFERSVYA